MMDEKKISDQPVKTLQQVKEMITQVVVCLTIIISIFQ